MVKYPCPMCGKGCYVAHATEEHSGVIGCSGCNVEWFFGPSHACKSASDAWVTLCEVSDCTEEDDDYDGYWND